MRDFSVLLQYPFDEGLVQTYLAHVRAMNPREAVRGAQAAAASENEWYEAKTFRPLLVCYGFQQDETPEDMR